MDSLPRRAVLGALALAGVGTAVSVAVRPRPARAPAPLFTPGRVLRSQPRKEYAQKLAAEVARYLAPTPDHPRHPWYPGAVVLTALRGDILAHEAVGEAVRYGPGAVELPAALRVPAATDTIYDLASLTKLFTTVLALRLVDHGELDLARPVSWYLPAFSGKPEATVAMLLTHTAGLPGDMDLKPLPDRDSRIAAVLAAPPLSAPGTQFRYSDLGFITLGVLVERLAGTRLDDLVAAQITGPLGMRDTGFAPLTAAWARGRRRSTCRGPGAVSCGARCTTRRRGRWAGSRATRASSVPPSTSRSWARCSLTAASTPERACCASGP